MKMLKIILHSALSILYTELEKPQMTLRLSLPNRTQLILRKDHGGEWLGVIWKGAAEGGAEEEIILLFLPCTA